LMEEAGGVEDVVGIGVFPGEGHVGGGGMPTPRDAPGLARCRGVVDCPPIRGK
jgi:hypothetical protein